MSPLDGFGGVFFFYRPPPDRVLGPSEVSFHKSERNEVWYCQGSRLAAWQRLRSNKWSQCGKDHLKRAEGSLVQGFYQQHPSAIPYLSPNLIICYGVVLVLCFEETNN